MKNTKKNHQQNYISKNSIPKMKNCFNRLLFWAICIFSLTIGMSSCSSGNDDIVPTNKELVTGKWQVTSGNLLLDNTKYIYINNDNTIDILTEDSLGFKGEGSTTITVTDTQINIAVNGPFLINYTLQNDKLTLQLPEGFGQVSLIRASTSPDVLAWIRKLNTLDEGPAPWRDYGDIAFDGNYILGYDAQSSRINKVNPTNFEVVGSNVTIFQSVAVEIEKSNDPNRQLFKSDFESSKFISYIYQSNEKYYESIELGRGITGIASIEPGYLWVGSSDEKILYKYKSNGALTPGEIMQTVQLNIKPRGLDYQNGYLYVSDGKKVHKCQTTPNFKAIESYELPDYSIYGIAFDGTNFWLNVRSNLDSSIKLVKSDL